MSADRFNAAVSKRIAALATMHNRTEATDKKIREAAAQRLAVVQADIDKLASRAQSDDKAGARYQELILERGRLNQVIGR